MATQPTDNQEIDFFEAIAEAIENDNDPRSNVQEVLDRGQAACYMNENGLMVKEFPDGRIYHINVDLKTGETIYLKRLN